MASILRSVSVGCGHACPLPGRAASWLVSRDLRCVRCALLHYYYYYSQNPVEAFPLLRAE